MKISRFNIDLTGEIFGHLTAVKRIPCRSPKSYDNWECLCDCGTKKISTAYNLLKGKATICTGKHLNLTGKRFDKLLVLKRCGTNNGNRLWECKCDCGTIRTLRSTDLIKRKVSNCGCIPHRKYEDETMPAKIVLYGKYKASAKKRDIRFNLKKEDFFKLTSSDCFYCGYSPSMEIFDSRNKKSPSLYVYNGIDRMNNRKGYTIDNCVPCCFRCNRAKNNRTLEKFLAWGKTLGERLIELYNYVEK